MPRFGDDSVRTAAVRPSLARWTRHSEASQALRAPSLSAAGASGLAAEIAGEDASIETSAMHAELRDVLKAAIGRLPGRTREILRLYHWRGMTMREIGLRHGIHQDRVSQIHKRALGLLAGALREQGITGIVSVLPTRGATHQSPLSSDDSVLPP